MSNVVILDLDGTISDDRHRRHHIVPKDRQVSMFTRYHAYHSLAGFDELVHSELTEIAGCENVIFTMRPEWYRTLTEEWLRRKGVQFTKLCMRPKCNYRPSEELKLDHLNQLRKPGCTVQHAYDDLPSVVRMYHCNGVEATLVKL